MNCKNKKDGKALFNLARELGKNDPDEAKKKYREALNPLYSQANEGERGDAEAQNYLGWMYEDGLGIEPDYGKARYWYEKSAAQDNTNAQYHLGMLYFHGKNGIKKDYDKAFSLVQKAADKNYSYALCTLGEMYYHGKGCKKDYEQAFNNYTKAVQQVHPPAHAQYKLGKMHNECEKYKDSEKAFDWYKKAADQKHAAAQCGLGGIYFDRYRASKNQQDLKQAFDWYEKSAKQGYRHAQNQLGHLYQVKGDDKESFYWYQKAAEQGVANSQFQLGFKYQNGKGVTRDIVQAYKWYYLAQHDEKTIRKAKEAFEKLGKKEGMTPIDESRAKKEATKLAEEWLREYKKKTNPNTSAGGG